MKELKSWIEKNGTEGRKQVFEAIKKVFPTFQQNSLTNYIAGERTPEFAKAQIISDVTGIPLEKLSWRYVNIPGKSSRSLACIINQIA